MTGRGAQRGVSPRYALHSQLFSSHLLYFFATAFITTCSISSLIPTGHCISLHPLTRYASSHCQTNLIPSLLSLSHNSLLPFFPSYSSPFSLTGRSQSPPAPRRNLAANWKTTADEDLAYRCVGEHSVTYCSLTRTGTFTQHTCR